LHGKAALACYYAGCPAIIHIGNARAYPPGDACFIQIPFNLTCSNTARTVNRFLEPAFFAGNEANDDLNRLSIKFGPPRTLPMPDGLNVASHLCRAAAASVAGSAAAAPDATGFNAQGGRTTTRLGHYVRFRRDLEVCFGARRQFRRREIRSLLRRLLLRGNRRPASSCSSCNLNRPDEGLAAMLRRIGLNALLQELSSMEQSAL
jgi:hypothetical protein